MENFVSYYVLGVSNAAGYRGIACFLAVYAVAATAIFFLVLYRKGRKNKERFEQYQNKLMTAQMEEVNHMYMAMRGWRHDYHNHMQKIRAHLGMGQMEEACRYIDEMAEDLTDIGFHYKSGNSNVDAILNSKLALAEKSQIAIKCDASVPEKLSVSSVDLCVILGNLVDNALEACEKIDRAEKRFLRIYLCVMKNQLYISVSNGTKELVRKLDKEYITNKRGNHGYGLKRIDDIVEKYQGYINRQNEPGVFATEILLPL